MTKLFVVLFVEKPANTLEQTTYMSTPTAISLLSAAVILPILGNPSVAGFVAENTVGIFNAHLEHLPDFFAFEALKGGLISIAIGFIVYFLFVRTVIIRKSTIRNLWPRALDMEDNFYRPLLLKVLPSIGGFVASIFAENKLLKPICRGALKVGAFISKLVCDSLDLILVFFRHSVFRDKHHRAHIISPSVEIVGSVATHTFHSKKSVLYFAEVISTLKITTRNIKNSFSFALISTCVGVCGVLIYILLA